MDLDRFSTQSSFDFENPGTPGTSYGALDMQQVEMQLSTPENKDDETRARKDASSTQIIEAKTPDTENREQRDSQLSQRSSASLSFCSVEGVLTETKGTT